MKPKSKNLAALEDKLWVEVDARVSEHKAYYLRSKREKGELGLAQMLRFLIDVCGCDLSIAVK